MEKELIGVLRGSNNNTQDFGETQHHWLQIVMPESTKQRILVFSILEDHLYRIGKDDNRLEYLQVAEPR